MSLPPRSTLAQLLGDDDFFLWEYYGEGFLGKVQAWIFRSRIKVLMKLLRKTRLKPKFILDVGSGPMFISYALVMNEAVGYIGVDIMCNDRLKKYRDAMRSFGMETIEVVRASADALPFRREVFDFALSLSTFLSILANQGKLLQKSTELLKMVVQLQYHYRWKICFKDCLG